MDQGSLVDQATGKIVDPKVLKSHSKTHEYIITDIENELATGMHINQYKKNAISFLEDLDNYNEKSDNIKSQIDISNKMFRN